MATITTKSVDNRLDVKRFYLPGVTIKDNCPNCKTECVYDLTDHYLSHPKLNTPEDCVFYCDNCDNDWKIQVRLNLNLELIVPKQP